MTTEAMLMLQNNSTRVNSYKQQQQQKNTIPAKYPNNKSCNDEDVLPFPTKTVLRPLKV